MPEINYDQDSSYQYQVGSGLSATAPSYVKRSADDKLFGRLMKGTFCYVFNSRQMGKTSLRNRTMQRLMNEQVCCFSIDLNNIGCTDVTAFQWYVSFIKELHYAPIPELSKKVNFNNWLAENHSSSPVNLLRCYIRDVLLKHVLNHQIVILIDEIDNLISLSFDTDDFFALIRASSDLREGKSDYDRLSFALFGVVTPSDLISNSAKTPFNIGTKIDLTGFDLEESTVLRTGLVNCVPQPEVALKEILTWTKGQPFLTQKLCNIISSGDYDLPELKAGSEKDWIMQLVKSHIIDNWEEQDEPMHLKYIQNRVLCDEAETSLILSLYQQILISKYIRADDSYEQLQLRLTGLVVRREAVLQVYNPIYEMVFDRQWVARELEKLRPPFYTEAFRAWQDVTEDQKDSFLLRGQVLRDARTWAKGKRLSELEYFFIGDSQEAETKAEKEKNLILETARQEAKQIDKKAKTKAKVLFFTAVLGAIAVVTGAIAVVTGAIAVVQKNVELSDILFQSGNQSFGAAKKFKTDQFLALLEALEAGQNIQSLASQKDPYSSIFLLRKKDMRAYSVLKVTEVLYQILYDIKEKTIPTGQDKILSLNWINKGKTLVTVGENGTVRLWTRDGIFIEEFNANQKKILSMGWNTDDNKLATGGEDGSIKLWSKNGLFIKPENNAHKGGVLSMSWSPDGRLVTGGKDGSIKIWDQNGLFIKQETNAHKGGVRSISWSSDGRLATGGNDGSIKLWNKDFSSFKIFYYKQNKLHIHIVSWNANGEILATCAEDQTCKLWDQNGYLIKEIRSNQGVVKSVSWSSDGRLATGGEDGTLKIWDQNGSRFIDELNSNQGIVNSLSWTKDGRTLAAGGSNGNVKLWNINRPRISSHKGIVNSLSWSSNSKILVTAGVDGIVGSYRDEDDFITHNLNKTKIDNDAFFIGWAEDNQTFATATKDGVVKLRNVLVPPKIGIPTGWVKSLCLTADGKILAMGGKDGTIKFWNRDTSRMTSISAHIGNVWSISWSPVNKTFATAGDDGTVKFWNQDGSPIQNKTVSNLGRIWSMAWSTDGKTLAIGQIDGTLILWNRDKSETQETKAHTGIINSMSWTIDSNIIATGGYDGAIKLWHRDLSPFIELPSNQGIIYSMSFSPDGKNLATGGKSGDVKLWPIKNLNQLIQQGCKWVASYLERSPNYTKKLTACRPSAVSLNAKPKP
jgi:WD40 repeat protein